MHRGYYIEKPKSLTTATGIPPVAELSDEALVDLINLKADVWLDFLFKRRVKLWVSMAPEEIEALKQRLVELYDEAAKRKVTCRDFAL